MLSSTLCTIAVRTLFQGYGATAMHDSSICDAPCEYKFRFLFNIGINMSSQTYRYSAQNAVLIPGCIAHVLRWKPTPPPCPISPSGLCLCVITVRTVRYIWLTTLRRLRSEDGPECRAKVFIYEFVKKTDPSLIYMHYAIEPIRINIPKHPHLSEDGCAYRVRS
ncbi:hypothetical protein T492DRAFT_153808 [Pavlovales sp. CCMP2436]|nr:hypothetical protein T492DRAFT_153808 [Pavlovales sp. CCMP2436]